MPLPKTIKMQGGFTLLELLIAITIFAIGLLTVAGMQLTAIRAGSTADNISVATAVAQGVLEELMSREAGANLFDADSSSPQDYPLDSGQMAGAMATVPGGSSYTASYIIDADHPSPGMARIDVTVSSATGRQMTLTGFKRVQ